ncbi:MAG: hypothetical protein KatS3mg084_0084 [Candidatus Dojkabacteria bacterium]|nr:MAG: hypothetical protein KatS3mg084_0084 [Candidatus Dojkabacteria bacterium]
MFDSNNAKIGKNIQKIRQKKGLTQAELAKKLGLVRPTLSLYESGKLNFSIDFLVLIAKTLEVQFLDILPDQLKQQSKQTDVQHISYDLDSDIEFTLQLSLKQYLLRHKVEKTSIETIISEILTFIDKRLQRQ